MLRRSVSACLAILVLAACGSGVDGTGQSGEDGGSDASDAEDAGVDARADATVDATVDSSTDASREDADAGTADARADAPLDAPDDGLLDSAPDAASDAPEDGTLDAAEEASDDAPDGGPLDSAMDAPTDGEVDAPVEASPDAAGGGPALVLTVISDGGYVAYGATYENGNWGPLSQLCDDYPAGGGVAALSDGRAISVIGGALSATWSLGSWSAIGAIPPTAGWSIGRVSPPVASSSGAFVIAESSQNLRPLLFLAFDNQTSTWSIDGSFHQNGSTFVAPAVSLEASGDPLVIQSVGEPSTTSPTPYASETRHAGAWTSLGTVPGIVYGPWASNTAFHPRVGTATRPGTDEIVAVFVTGAAPSTGAALTTASFMGGAWTSPLPLASDATGLNQLVDMSIVALPDGRVALAYFSNDQGVRLGFYDGASWSAFTTIPLVTPTSPFDTLAIAPGINGAVIELVYIGGMGTIEHTRLTDEASWTWSMPQVVTPGNSFQGVYLGTRP